MNTQKLYLNTLTFSLPKEPVKCYFSASNDANHKSTIIKSTTLTPAEVRQSPKFIDLFSGNGDFCLFTSFDKALKGFEVVAIDFSEPDNENYAKRYYNRRLEDYFRQFDDVVVTKSGITNDIQVWVHDKDKTRQVEYHGKRHELWQMDRFTLRVRYDSFNGTPYLLVACNRPAFVLSVSLATLFSTTPDDPFGNSLDITADTTVRVFSNAVVTNNVDYNYGDQISFIWVEQLVDPITGYPRCKFHGEYVVLDKTSEVTLRSLVSETGFSVMSGNLACSLGDSFQGAYAWVHSRKGGGRTLVSSQVLVVRNTLYDEYSTEEAYQRAVATYGGESDSFLTPEDQQVPNLRRSGDV